MKKDKRKKIFIISILIIFMIVSVIWASLKIFLKINNKIEGIQASKSEFNTELEENEHMHIEEDINGEKVPVPNGYVGSRADGENGINAGYVIYEGEEEVTNDNVEEAQKTRNQYVWVPVPDISQFYGTDENGKKWGKLYEFTTETGENVDEITGTKPLNWSEDSGIMKIINTTSSYREPDVVIKNNSRGYDMNFRIKNFEIGATSSHEFLMEIEKDFNQMIESVEKYGGFYIGRYETGDLNQENAVIKKGNTSITSTDWYTMYNKCKNIKKDNMNIETGMIWGNQWDRTLMWLIESGRKTKEEICDSTTWGNYKNAKFDYINSNGITMTKENGNNFRIPTGNSEYTKANNIYDLAGNVWDWTLETYSVDFRVDRGGGYNNDGGSNSSNIRAFSYPNYIPYNIRL